MKPNWTGITIWIIVLAAIGLGTFFLVNSLHREPAPPIAVPSTVAPPPAPPKATAEPIPTPRARPLILHKRIGTPTQKPVTNAPLDIRSVAQLCTQYVAYRNTPEWRKYCHGYR